MRSGANRQQGLVRIATTSRQHVAYRTARLVVYSTFIVQSIYGAVHQYAGIDRPEWVDLR